MVFLVFHFLGDHLPFFQTIVTVLLPTRIVFVVFAGVLPDCLVIDPVFALRTPPPRRGLADLRFSSALLECQERHLGKAYHLLLF